MGLTVRVVHGEGCWCVEHRGKRRLFGLLPGHWHVVECYKRLEPAQVHAGRLGKYAVRNTKYAK
jgi:hypothetical protein